MQVPRMDTAEYTVETESAPGVEQTSKKGVNKTLTLAILTAVGAAVVAGRNYAPIDGCRLVAMRC